MGRNGQCSTCAESFKAPNGWNYCGRYDNYCKPVARNCPAPTSGPKKYKDYSPGEKDGEPDGRYEA